MTLLNTINLPWSTPATPANTSEDYRAVAADQSGNIFLATWNGQVHKFASDGTYLATLTPSTFGLPNYGLWDVDIDTDGALVFTGGSTVYESTTALDSITGHFNIGADGFVAFAHAAAAAPPPTPTITVSDAAVVEANSGQQSLFFTVKLSNVYTSAVTVDYATADGTATLANNDYVAASGTLTFAPGETSKVVTVKAVGDTTDEHNETFRLNLANPTNATLATDHGTGTIADDDPAPVSKVASTVATAVVRDYTGSGTFTEQISGTDALLVRRFDYTGNPTIPLDERSVLEFDTRTIAAQDVTGATLQLYCYSTTSSTTAVEVYGYPADGTATLDDATRPAVLLASFRPTGPGTYTVPLDLAGLLKSFPAGTQYFGLRLSGVAPTNVGFYGTNWGTNAPKLTFQTSISPPYLSVSDTTVNEGDYAQFTLSVDRPIGTSATVSYFTVAGTATQDTDYSFTSGSITFGPNDTLKTVLVPTVGDAIADSGETFNLYVTTSVSATTLAIGDDQGTATIVDVPNPTPGVRISDASVTEGNSGTTPMTFTVTLSVPSANTVTVNYATADFNATAPADYQNTTGTLTFAPGETSKTITVNVVADNLYENGGASQTFRVNLSNLVNGTLLDGQGVGTIIEDDPRPIISIDDATVVEGNSGTANAVVTIRLSNPSDNYIGVNYGTADGTAQSKADYTARTGQAFFNPGDVTLTFTVPIFGDTFTEGNETVRLGMSLLSGIATINNGNALLTIQDDDPTSGTMAFTSASWAYAEDNGPNGTIDSLNQLNGFDTVIRKTATLEDRALFEFDVRRVVSGAVTYVMFDLGVDAFTSSDGPVAVYGYAADGTVTLADATRTATLPRLLPAGHSGTEDHRPRPRRGPCPHQRLELPRPAAAGRGIVREHERLRPRRRADERPVRDLPHRPCLRATNQHWRRCGHREQPRRPVHRSASPSLCRHRPRYRCPLRTRPPTAPRQPVVTSTPRPAR